MPNATFHLETRDFLAALDLDRANVEEIRIYHEHQELQIFIQLNPRPHNCPICQTLTSKVKGYQTKKIKHSVLNPIACTIHYRARRYICPLCGKTFYEHNPFVFHRLRVSVATVYNVINELKRPEATFQYIATKYHMSASSVANLFDRHIQVERRPLPTCLCFDETYAFKSADSDYICVLLDYTNKKIVDILPSRRKQYLIDYFSKIPIEERNNVRYVSYDMWYTYRNVAKAMFPKSVGIVDKFHVLQDLSRRVTRVRVQVMNTNKKQKDLLEQKRNELKKTKAVLSPQEAVALREAQVNYYLLKKFHFVLFSNNPAITNPNIKKKFNRYLNRYCNLYDLYDMVINIDKQLKEAVEIRDAMHRFYKETEYKDAKVALEEIIITCRTSNVIPIQEFSTTLTQWKSEIINSFIKIPGLNKKMNNALIENRNKTIKLLKHSSNGYTCWSRFRTRVLFTLNDDIPIKL